MAAIPTPYMLAEKLRDMAYDLEGYEWCSADCSTKMAAEGNLYTATLFLKIKGFLRKSGGEGVFYPHMELATDAAFKEMVVILSKYRQRKIMETIAA